MREHYTHLSDTGLNDMLYTIYTEKSLPNGWDDDDQRGNFEQFFRMVEASGISIVDASCIDIGCGTGTFFEYWKKNGGGKYHGIDIFQPSLTTARNQYPQAKFTRRDVLNTLPSSRGKYDFAVLSGVITISRQTGDNYDFMQQVLTHATDMTRQGILFNFLTTSEPKKDEFHFYYDPIRVINICREVAPDWEIRMSRSRHLHQRDVFLFKRPVQTGRKTL